jgi:hypothetical protein
VGVEDPKSTAEGELEAGWEEGIGIQEFIIIIALRPSTSLARFPALSQRRHDGGAKNAHPKRHPLDIDAIFLLIYVKWRLFGARAH